MSWRRGLSASLLIVFGLGLLGLSVPSVEAFGPYQTLYVGHLDYGTGRSFEFTYTYHDDITHHALTFDAAAGAVLSIDARWVANVPEKYLDHTTWGWWQYQPEPVVIRGEPPVNSAQVFTWDWDGDFSAGKFLPSGVNLHGQLQEGWTVPETGRYMLYLRMYPYQETTGGVYRVTIMPGGGDAPAATPTIRPTSPPAPDPSDGWTGEFPQQESGDRYIHSTITGNPDWSAHSFPADPGDMLTIMAWGAVDTPADQLEPRLVLCEGGCDPSDEWGEVASAGGQSITVVNYQVPGNVAPGTLYTAMVHGDDTTGGYHLWMRQWNPDDLLDQIAGGWMGEFTQVEGAENGYRMDGVLSSSAAFQVHSFRADPGDFVRVTVQAKRETPADELIPVVLLVPGGYEPGEQWLAMDVAVDASASANLRAIPDIMPPDTLYTVVVGDTSNLGHLLFGEEAVYEYAGAYTVTLVIASFN